MMRRTPCSFGRIKPTKFLMTSFFLSIVVLNWSYLTYESRRFKLSVRHNELNHVNASIYRQIERFLRGGYTVLRINEASYIVTIELIKKEKDRLDYGNIPHDNLGSEKIADAKMVSGSLNGQAKMRTSWNQSEEKDLGNHLNSKDETEVDIHVTDEKDFSVTAPVIDYCPNNTLGNIDMLSYGRCKPHKPTVEGCREAQRQLYYDPKPCKNPFQGDVCTLNVYTNNRTKMLRARCNKSLCDEGRLRFFSVKTLNPNNGEHDVIRYFSTIKQLEHHLPSILILSHKVNNYNYVILRCRGIDGKMKSQLLPLDPRYTIQENKTTSRDKSKLNVNIVLIDSVARDHFYRSLPKTIHTFKHLTKTTSRVFDFELFQAVEGHTAENTHALFTGSLFPPSSNRDAIRPVGMEKLFGTFKNAGYQTMWQEDLCWKGYWGLLTDLAISLSWRTLAPKLKQVYIDHTGITHSSCEVLKTYKLVSPFQGPSDKICYNGKYQHSYFLDYIEENLRAITENKNALPLVSYTSLSVGHDMYGRRIQTIDQDLSRFVERMAKEDSTLTILLADHGNTYTSYVTSQEGKFEMFHPSLFFIIPDKVGKLLGQKALEALYENQRRLVTMVDLHHSIMALARPISPQGVELKGVFGHIPYNRTCDEVELRTPNMCVCEGWDSPTTNDTLKLAFAEFAIGQLNNIVTKQAMSLPLVKSSCHRLQPSRYENIRVRNTKGGGLVTSMDIIIPAGDVSTVKEDMYHVEVHSKESIGMTSLDMKLNHFEKLTPYGVYSSCRDEGVNKKLCVCSRRRKKRVSRIRLKLFVKRQLRNFQGKVIVNEIEENECLLLIKRIHGKDDAHAYEVANICTNQSHGVLVTISDVYNMKTSRDGPIEVAVPPGSIIFLLSAMKDIEFYQSSINVKAVLVSI